MRLTRASASNRSRTVDRRRFLQTGAAAVAAISATSCSRSRTKWRFLTDQDGRTLAALCDQIVPPDDYPGAAEAGAVEYIDRQLMRHYRRHRAAYRRGLADTDRLSLSRFGHPFAELSAIQQIEVVHNLERERRMYFRALARPAAWHRPCDTPSCAAMSRAATRRRVISTSS